VTLALTTTTVTVRRPASAGDPTDAPTVTTVAAAHPAHIGSPSGGATFGTGTAEQVDATLTCDTLALYLGDQVDDDITGERWSVVWSRQRIGVGLDHTTAGLRRVKPGG
jgi:hypothetical protein